MTTQNLTIELQAVAAAVRESGRESVRELSQILAVPRSVVVAPSGAVGFAQVTVYPTGTPLVVAEVDRLRVTVTNRGAASVFLHSKGQTDPTDSGVELAAGDERTIATRAAVWASCTTAAVSVRVDVVTEAVG